MPCGSESQFSVHFTQYAGPGSGRRECGTITKVDTTGWVHVKMMRRIGGRGSAFIEICRQVQELELVGDEEAENNVVNNGGLDLGNLLYSANLYSDKPDKGDIDGKMVTAYDENAPPTLTSLKSSQWNGTKANRRKNAREDCASVQIRQRVDPRNAEHEQARGRSDY